MPPHYWEQTSDIPFIGWIGRRLWQLLIKAEWGDFPHAQNLAEAIKHDTNNSNNMFIFYLVMSSVYAKFEWKNIFINPGDL